MPAGGRPPLSDEQIKLISTWINEGATLDGSSPDQPLRVMTSLAWARDASHDELMERRKQIADKNWSIGSPSDQPTTLETENFYVMGSVGKNTLRVVADQAEAACDYFAGCLLVPKHLLKRLYDDGEHNPARLAARFGVSTTAMRVRLSQVGLRPYDHKRPWRSSRHD